ncbi:MAG: C69 family dipeptidase [Candidatus Nanopelagicales bacterium]
MCDTFVALGDSTADGSVVFGKNSDREPNEAHEVTMVSAGEHPDGSRVRCTHISVPQVRRTHRVLLAKPYWIWGAEMGVNERGVVIGNEALFNRGTREDSPGLIGMDLLRLGLERADTAAEAVAVISELLQRHGQSGQAGHTHDFQYDNSFIATDRTEAWILETMGRDWVARRVTDRASISNGLTTRTTWDLASVGISDGTDVARQFAEPVYTRFADATGRQCRTTDALDERRGSLTVADAMDLLRHHDSTDAAWSPSRALIGQDVCMHAGFGPVRSSQTTGSLVARLGDDGVTVWVTGASAPCTATFTPVWVDIDPPDFGPRPRGYFDPDTKWWRHELLHRATLRDYPHRIRVYGADRDALQEDLLNTVPAANAPAAERAAFSSVALERVERAESEWLNAVSRTPVDVPLTDRLRTAPYRRAWDSFDRQARMPEEN